jgi:hypothetical protein
LVVHWEYQRELLSYWKIPLSNQPPLEWRLTVKNVVG